MPVVHSDLSVQRVWGWSVGRVVPGVAAGQ
jgi:hypothetical protein